MEFHEKEARLPFCHVVADTTNELPIDGEFVLPDYCPDMAAVLKCTLTATVQSRRIQGENIGVDGTVQVEVLYLEKERREVNCAAFTQPFHTSFSLSEPLSAGFAQVFAHTNYVHCHATDARRLDIHGSVSVRLCASARAEERVLSQLEGEGLFARCVPVHTVTPAAEAEKSFTVNERLDFGGRLQGDCRPVRTEFHPRITDCKVLVNKAIVKGELELKTVCRTDSDEGSLFVGGEVVPFSQIVDMEGLTEEWICDPRVQTVQAELRPEPAGPGESPLLALTARLTVLVQAWQEETVTVVSDAYAAHFPLKPQIGHIAPESLQTVERTEHTFSLSVDTPSDTARELLDVWCELGTPAMNTAESGSLLSGRITFCVLVREENGTVEYYERAETFSYPFSETAIDPTPQVTAGPVSGHLSADGKLELQVPLYVTRRCRTATPLTAVQAVEPEEGAAYPPPKAALCVCYAKAGESVWEIARRYHTSPQAVAEENRLEEESLFADTVLLIPLL